MKIYQLNLKLIICCISVLISAKIHAQEKIESDTTILAQIDFEVTEYNFGDVYQGEKVEHIFDFKNNGNIALVIQNVLTTCGCAAPEWPKNPIQPGDSGHIKIVFDSSAKIGRQNKVITIRSNAKSGDFSLRISAMVLPSKKKE